MTEDGTSRVRDGQLADPETWAAQTLAEIRQTRKMLGFWLDELAHYVEGDGQTDEVKRRDRKICERTRMVLVAGETLHNLTRIFMRWSEQGMPETAWDAETAARTDRLLEAAVREAQTSPYKDNCIERLDYVRGMWSSWCASFEPAAITAV